MYNEIEQEFYKKSESIKLSKFLFLLFIADVLIYIIGIIIFGFSFFLLIMLLIVVVFLTIFSCYINAYRYAHKDSKATTKNFLCYKQNIAVYKKRVHEEDMLHLGVILEDLKIVSNDKILEVLNHYRNLLPVNSKKTTDWVAFTSLVISLITLFASEFFVNNVKNMYIAIAVLVIMMSLYFDYNFLKQQFSYAFDKNEMYKRIETSISEIYLNNLVQK